MEFLTSDEAERYCSEKLQLDICDEELTEIISIIELYDIENLKTEAYRKLGDKYYYNNKYGEAIEYYTKALDFCERIGDNNSSICILYNLIGACKYAELMYEEALFFLIRQIYLLLYLAILLPK